jgi:NDP-sugar pyrophosphorylase family protein
MTDRQAVILAGGKGARLAPFNTVLPKPLMPLGEVSILEIVLRQLDREGFSEAVLATGHLSEIIEAYCASLNPKLNLSLRVVKEEKPLGTIGPLKRIEGLEDDFLLMNGDLLTTLPFSEVLEKRREKKSLALLTVGERTMTLDFGLLETDAEGSVVRYREKPSLANLVSYGVYAFSRGILEWIPTDAAFDLPDLVQLLIEGNRKVDTFLYSGYWKDIGRPEDYEAAKADFLAEPEKFLKG